MGIGFSAENIVDPVIRQPRGEVELIRDCKDRGDFRALEELGRQLIKLDLRFVDVSDFLIVHLFPGIETCGTWDELFEARRQRKPVFVINPVPLEDTSIWLMGRVGLDQIFKTKEEVVERLRQIRDGEVAPPSGWRNIYERATVCNRN
jgi:hypothetical protein